MKVFVILPAAGLGTHMGRETIPVSADHQGIVQHKWRQAGYRCPHVSNGRYTTK
jgi:hypothetical protein